MEKPTDNQIEVKNLTLAYGDFLIQQNLNFDIKRGEVFVIMGGSGCGKTTLGRAILQLVPTTSGKIILNGKDMTTLSPKILRESRKDLQIVFQDPYGSLNPRLSIGEAILEPLNVHSILKNKNERKEKVMELLQKVNLNPDQFNRYPHQFSGGQRQRICIARALALNPNFLIFVILPVYPPSIACFRPFSLIINNVFFLFLILFLLPSCFFSLFFPLLSFFLPFWFP